MKLPRLPMGCLSSRSTIAPSERVENTSLKIKLPTKPQQTREQESNNEESVNNILRGTSNDLKPKRTDKIKPDKAHNDEQASINSSTEAVDDDIMSILMNNQDKSGEPEVVDRMQLDDSYHGHRARRTMIEHGNQSESENHKSLDRDRDISKATTGNSFDDEPNQELLRQYVAIDYEITLLEDKDALRVYHEKIEQLEQLERELDMISSEAEEVASRSETGTQLDRQQSINGTARGRAEAKLDMESNSMMSGVTGSMSRRSNAKGRNDMSQQASVHDTPNKDGGTASESQMLGMNRNYHNLSYSTVEEVFNRKILLEKERDKLKKEVEMVIVECDKLQQRYKKRDEILDKLFDGRTGNGLENHLEQQLNWLLEQKHYVDQVFYAWKRAETLTSQICEQFTSALELLKRLPKVEDPDQKSGLVKSISELLIKSRKDIERAQQYNPNVDAPFFTDNETERFDTIIESLSATSLSPTEYSQILTVIQFAYKRAVSIRLWLEQILQTTIARDSFELAEEYKWIAIQLRKERINLIKSKLQNTSYQPMIQSIQEQMARKESMSERRQHEINRDSGIESETNDIDIEEEIYRLLEQNKSRLQVDNTGSKNNNSPANDSNRFKGASAANEEPGNRALIQKLKVIDQNVAIPSATSSSDSTKDQKMRERIQKRVKSNQPLLTAKISNGPAPVSSDRALGAGGGSSSNGNSNRNIDVDSNEVSLSIGTPTRLKIELDEEAKQSLLKQVDEVHSQHKNKIERLRGNNRAKAATILMNRMQQVRVTKDNSGSEAASETAR